MSQCSGKPAQPLFASEANLHTHSNRPSDPFMDPIAAIAAAVEQLFKEAETSNPSSNPSTGREAESQDEVLHASTEKGGVLESEEEDGEEQSIKYFDQTIDVEGEEEEYQSASKNEAESDGDGNPKVEKKPSTTTTTDAMTPPVASDVDDAPKPTFTSVSSAPASAPSATDKDKISSITSNTKREEQSIEYSDQRMSEEMSNQEEEEEQSIEYHLREELEVRSLQGEELRVISLQGEELRPMSLQREEPRVMSLQGEIFKSMSYEEYQEDERYAIENIIEKRESEEVEKFDLTCQSRRIEFCYSEFDQYSDQDVEGGEEEYHSASKNEAESDGDGNPKVEKKPSTTTDAMTPPVASDVDNAPKPTFTSVSSAPASAPSATDKDKISVDTPARSSTSDQEFQVSTGETILVEPQPPSNKDRIDFNPNGLWGNTFVRGLKVGFQSFHFEGANAEGKHQAFVSFEDFNVDNKTLDDKSTPHPRRVPFDDISYDADTRTFKGVLEWEKRYNTTRYKCACERLEMIFDEEYTCIKGGTIRSDGEVKETWTFGTDFNYINASLEAFIETKTKLLVESEGRSKKHPEMMLKVNQHLLKRLNDEEVPPETIDEVCRILGGETVQVPEKYYEEIIDEPTRARRKEAWNDKKFVISMVKEKCSLEKAADKLKEDREVVIAALEEDWDNVQYIKNIANYIDDEEILDFIADKAPHHQDTIFEWIKDEDNSTVLRKLVKKNPKISVIKDSWYGRVMDYYAANPSCIKAMKAALENHREFVIEKLKEGLLSLNHAADHLKEDREVIFNALEGDLNNLKYVPKNVNTNEDEELLEHIAKQSPHHPDAIFEWIQEDDKTTLLHELVRRDPQIVDLTNKEGQKAVNIAYPKCKEAMEKALYLFSKFKVKNEKPIHQSRTACVLKAKVNITDTNTNETRKENVALKCMKSYDQAMSEINGRKGLDQNYVLGIKAVHVDPSFSKDDKYVELLNALKESGIAVEEVKNLVSEVSAVVKNRKRGLTGEIDEEEDVMYNFVLQLDYADRVLETIIKHDRVSDNSHRIKMVLSDLICALGHLHGKKIIHGDVKPLNIVQQGSKFNMIDMDVSCSIGKSFGSKRPSTGFCPPEVAKLLFDGQLKDYKGHESYDIWSVGVIAYRLATNQELFQTDGDDNIIDEEKDNLIKWDEKKLEHKMKKLKDPSLKNLLKKILHHDPKERMRHYEGGGIKVILEDAYFDKNKDSTGLYNQATFKMHKTEWESRAQKSLCAAFAIDVANFKSVNDTFSHDVGDEALVSLAKQIKELSLDLPNSEAYHSGGDEYQVLALCDDNEEDKFKEEVTKAAKRLSTIEFERSPVTCFLRIGVVCFIGATYDQADKLEHSVKDKIMRDHNAKDRDPVYDTVPKERFIVKFKKDKMNPRFISIGFQICWHPKI